MRFSSSRLRHPSRLSVESADTTLRPPVPDGFVSASQPATMSYARGSLGYPGGLFMNVAEEKVTAASPAVFAEQTPAGRKRARSPSADGSTKSWMLSALSKLPLVGSLISPAASGPASQPDATAVVRRPRRAHADEGFRAVAPRLSVTRVSQEISPPRPYEPSAPPAVYRETPLRPPDVAPPAPQIAFRPPRGGAATAEAPAPVLRSEYEELPSYADSDEENRDLLHVLQLRQKYGLSSNISSPPLPAKRQRVGAAWDPFSSVAPVIYNPLDPRCQPPPASLAPPVVNPFAATASTRMRQKRGLRSSDYRKLLRQTKFHPCKWIDYFEYAKASEADKEDRRFFATPKETVPPRPSTERPPSPRRPPLGVVLVEMQKPAAEVPTPEPTRELGVFRAAARQEPEAPPRKKAVPPEKRAELQVEARPPAVPEKPKVIAKPSPQEGPAPSQKPPPREKPAETPAAEPAPWWLANVGKPVQVAVEEEGVFAEGAEEPEGKPAGAAAPPPPPPAAPSAEPFLFGRAEAKPAAAEPKPLAPFIFGAGAAPVEQQKKEKSANPAEEPKPTEAAKPAPAVSLFGPSAAAVPSLFGAKPAAAPLDKGAPESARPPSPPPEAPAVKVVKPTPGVLEIGAKGVTETKAAGEAKPTAPEKASAAETLFGAAKAGAAPLFGVSPAAEPAKPPVALFGAEKQEPAKPSLFPAPAGGPSLFGKPAEAKPATPSLFGAPSTPLFGAPPGAPAPSASLFGAPSGAAPSLFGGTKPEAPPSQPPATGLFGASPPPTDTPAAGGIFGAPAAAQPSTTGPSLFGATQAPAGATTAPPATPSLFGTPSAQPSLFGAAAKPAFGQEAQRPSLFGTSQPSTGAEATPKPTPPSLFGTPAPFGAEQPQQSPPLFGQRPATPSGSLFGTPATATPTQPSLFGQQAPPQETGTPSLFGTQSQSLLDVSSSQPAAALLGAGTPSQDAARNPFAANVGGLSGSQQRRPIIRLKRTMG